MGNDNLNIGRIGRARLEYIMERRPAFYRELVASGELEEYLQKVESDQGDLYGTIYRQAKEHDSTLTDGQADMMAREVSMYFTVNPESERDYYDEDEEGE